MYPSYAKNMKLRVASFTDYLLFSIVYLVQGALGLSAVAMPLFQRNVLNLSIPEIAWISGIVGIPWVLKPIYGLLSDYYPLFKLRRKPYLLIASSIACVGWFLTGMMTDSFWTLIVFQLIAAIGIASTDVFADGLAVQKSNDANRGLIQSICWGSRSVGAIITGFAGGWLLGVLTYQQVFLWVAALPLLVFLTSLCIREKKVDIAPKRPEKLLKHLYKSFIGEKQLLIAGAFLFIWFITPSFGAPLFFYLKETLQFSDMSLGLLVSISSTGGLVGAILYATILDRFRLKNVLLVLVWVNFFWTFIFLTINSQMTAYIIYFFTGIIGYMSLIPCMKLTAEVCPKGIEASAFAVVTGIVNLSSGVFAPWIGGILFKFLGLQPLIIISAFAGLLALFVLRYLE